MNVAQNIDTKTIVENIIESLKETRGQDIISIDISKLQNTVWKNYIICHGDSNTQVNALAQNVERFMEENLNVKVWRKQGFENCEWIVLDYVDVLVHIFQKDVRSFYNLEGLWADGKLTHFENTYFK